MADVSVSPVQGLLDLPFLQGFGMGRNKSKRMRDSLPDWHARVYYDPKNPSNLKDFQNRQLFLRVAAANVEGFANGLLRATVPLVSDWIKRNGRLPAPDSPRVAEFYIPFFTAIHDWARGFNIEVDWVIREAQHAVFLGILYANKGMDPALAFGNWRRSLDVAPTTRTFLLPAWDPYSETVEDFVVRANGEWQRLRDEYVAAITKQLIVAGMKKVPRTRKRRLSKETHFTWAALNLCGGMSLVSLADRFEEDTEVVRISVARVLKDLRFQQPT